MRKQVPLVGYSLCTKYPTKDFKQVNSFHLHDSLGGRHYHSHLKMKTLICQAIKTFVQGQQPTEQQSWDWNQSDSHT